MIVLCSKHLLGISDDQLRKKLFDDAVDQELSLEQGINKFRVAKNSKNDMAVIQSDASVQVVRPKSKHFKQNQAFVSKDDGESAVMSTHKKTNKNLCGNHGLSHPPRKCPAFGEQYHNCHKYNHYKSQCRSKKSVQIVKKENNLGFFSVSK